MFLDDYFGEISFATMIRIQLDPKFDKLSDEEKQNLMEKQLEKSQKARHDKLFHKLLIKIEPYVQGVMEGALSFGTIHRHESIWGVLFLLLLLPPSNMLNWQIKYLNHTNQNTNISAHFSQQTAHDDEEQEGKWTKGPNQEAPRGRHSRLYVT